MRQERLMNDKTRQIDTVDDETEPDYGPSILRRAYRPWRILKAWEEMGLILYERAFLDSRAAGEVDDDD